MAWRGQATARQAARSIARRQHVHGSSVSGTALVNVVPYYTSL